MSTQDKDSVIARLQAENEELAAKLARVTVRNAELQQQAYMARQYVEETHSTLMQVHVGAHKRVAAVQERQSGLVAGQLHGISKDPRWDIS